MSKRALIVGINKFQRVNPLNGCVNDAVRVKDILGRLYGFQEADIKVLTDAQATAAAIRSHLKDWLLTGYAGDGSDVRLFHFSSHGTQVDDQGGDEWECKDEVIVTHDHDWDDPFRDDHLREIFDPVPDNVNFSFVADCCHSGSIQKDIFDIASEIRFSPRYVSPPAEVMRRIEAKIEQRDAAADAFAVQKLSQELQGLPADQIAAKIEEVLARARKSYRDNNFAVVPADRHVLLAACEDKQTAADAFIDNDYRGAFTWSVTKAIEEAGGDLTHEDLITRAAGHISRYSQIPQLECPGDWRPRKFLAPLG